jgi:repressor LexA
MHKKSSLPSKPSSLSLAPPAPRSLTPKEKLVLEFIEGYVSQSGISPSYQEIKDHFELASFNSVQNYLKQLTQKGYVALMPHQKRAIQLLQSSNSFSATGSSHSQLLQARGEVLSLPLLGGVAAGQPLEKSIHDESVEVPPSMVKKPGETYALRVFGQSMVDEGILDGDLILVQKIKVAGQGDLIVAMIEAEATVKRYYVHAKNPRAKRIELRPSNSQMSSFWYPEEKIHIEGRVVGLIRKF